LLKTTDLAKVFVTIAVGIVRNIECPGYHWIVITASSKTNDFCLKIFSVQCSFPASAYYQHDSVRSPVGNSDVKRSCLHPAKAQT